MMKLHLKKGWLYLDEINRGLDTTDLFVIFISYKYLDADWVKYEIDKAVLIAKTNGSSKDIGFVQKNLKNYTDKALERLKIKYYLVD